MIQLKLSERDKKLFSTLLFIVIVSCIPTIVNAQVTIGSNQPPSRFSLLYIDASDMPRGLHNARLTQTERDALVHPDSVPAVQAAARGLMIFNITNNCLEYWDGSRWISFCANNNSISRHGGVLTAFVNVMYDFQQQNLEAFTTQGNGEPTSWQWQMSTDNITWTDIAGAPNAAIFNIPPRFMYTHGGVTEGTSGQNPAGLIHTREIFFRCKLSNTDTPQPVATNSVGILFIRTNTSGFGTDAATGTRYLTMNKTTSTGTQPVQVALLNQGATYNDGIGLGNFFQWGRGNDGHEQTLWSKDTDRYNTVAAASGNWSASTLAVWGNNTRLRHEAPANISGWTTEAQANNPCPQGWRVPSRFDFGDMHQSSGTRTGSWATGIVSGAGGIAWSWRAMNVYAKAYGGMILTNSATGETLFLPAAGYRNATDGMYNRQDARGGLRGNYWTSTVADDEYAFELHFGHKGVTIGKSGQEREKGFNVRCVR